MKLLDIYTGVLRSAGMVVQDDGFVSRLNAADKLMPVTIADEDGNRLRLTLPTAELVRSGDWAGKVAFHPLSENIVRGESEIITLLRKSMTRRMTQVLGGLMYDLMAIAVDKDRHKELRGPQHELTAAVPKANAKTLKNLELGLGKLNNASRRLCKIFLKRGGKVNDETFDRAFIADVVLDIKEDRSWYGVKLRVDDVETIKAMLEYILPAWDTQDWCYGSNDKNAPYLHALLVGYGRVMVRLNTLINLFSDRIENFEDELTDVCWIGELHDLATHRHAIPPLRGNAGKSSSNEIVNTETAPKSSRPVINGGEVEVTMSAPQPGTSIVDRNAPVTSHAPATGKVAYTSAIPAHQQQMMVPSQQMVPQQYQQQQYPQQMVPQQQGGFAATQQQQYPQQQTFMPQQAYQPTAREISAMREKQGRVQQYTSGYAGQVPAQYSYR